MLSGNRNFEGRIHALVRANYLASPPLVVAYALAGTMRINLATDPLGEGSDGKPVYLRDIWPTNQEVADTVRSAVQRDSFQQRYGNVFEGPPEWRAVTGASGMTYDFQDRLDLSRAAALFREHAEGAGADRRRRPARANWRFSATASPPTTSRPRAASRSRARPASS